ncbi:MAG: imidazole glycerol phosphate synthase subunit HisH [Candidatus Omnitrophica bacterium]|nr:imidazole glycerol phosphate synthase subunit HisH [Candidatus Omnitrophota bacterium]MDD5671818.1 imidazole glycerol phosphate synthase subunit HisH [Candidatus Omnitrophota bacterium]
MIAVVDYNMGNLRSVSKALEHLGAEVRVSAEARDIARCDKLVLPGVGAFKDAIWELKARGLFDPIREHIRTGKPFFGICLGLQLLFLHSDENPDAEGLGIFPGRVRRFESGNVKIPHMGWNEVAIRKPVPMLDGVPDGSSFYFVHSYYAVPDDPELVGGVCEYGSDSVTAILAHDNVFATQFHPEKSQEMGLRILKNFIEKHH